MSPDDRVALNASDGVANRTASIRAPSRRAHRHGDSVPPMTPLMNQLDVVMAPVTLRVPAPVTSRAVPASNQNGIGGRATARVPDPRYRARARRSLTLSRSTLALRSQRASPAGSR
jgi:hypothetical protein